METFDNALGALRAIPHWFLWRRTWNPEKQKFDKVPCPLNGGTIRIDASKAVNWATYTQACAALATLPHGEYLLGFWLTRDCGFWFLDLDHANGSDFATQLVAAFPGALVEVSSGGEGWHVIARHTGTVPEHRTRPVQGVAAAIAPLGLEFYTQDRGIAFGLSGEASGCADQVFDVAPLVSAYFKREPLPLPGAIRTQWRGPADDAELIRRMLAARQSAAATFGAKASLRDLWAGNCTLDSEHDMALAAHLAFWTGCNEPRIERLMRASGLVRDKWNESRPGGTYLTYTIRNACAGTTNVYQEPVPTSTAAPVTTAGRVQSAADLMAQEFKPVQWAVHGIVPEGVTILSGDPKIGKSWLVYQMCIAVSAGVPLWQGRQPEQSGDTLYLSLEDNKRRLKLRLSQLVRAFPMPVDITRLHYTTEWPRAEAGVTELAAWLREHPECRLVVIDTVSAFRDTDPGRKSAYAHDYAVGEMFKPLAREFNCAIVLVMHNRKQAAGDVMQRVSGTQGMTGGVDNVLVLERGRGDLDAALHVDGRDIEDPTQLAMRFEKNGSWHSLGRLSDVQRSKERNAMFEAIASLGGCATVKELHAAMPEQKLGAIRTRLSRMVKSGELKNDAGIYTLPFTAVPLSAPPLPGSNLKLPGA